MAYHNAFDKNQNGLNNEREGNNIDTRKIWWVQAESVLVHAWKCPYHNGRMCMEMINRLSQAS